MAIHALHIDMERCVACFACEVACEVENKLPVGANWIRILKTEKVLPDGKIVSRFNSILCQHCEDFPCAAVCPEHAIVRRTDGIVLIDVEKCTGCGLCVENCPFGAMELNQNATVVQKCTMCAHRIDKGLEPSCAMHCPAEAISFVSADSSPDYGIQKESK